MRNWLIAIRVEKGMTQKAVAQAIGVSQPTYCNIEKGDRNPGVAVAKRTAAVLGFDWTRFYEEDDKSA
jgi:DNA-binding XRE family transcriptional regulator